MKKLKYLILILFIFPSIVYGSEIRRDLIDVTIHADGTASFTETWEVPEQHDTLFKKDFFNAKGVEISDFKIVNKSGLEYKYVKRLDKNERKTFSKTTHERSTSYNIVLDTYKDDVYTITYNVNGMIKKYSDGVYGIILWFKPFILFPPPVDITTLEKKYSALSVFILYPFSIGKISNTFSFIKRAFSIDFKIFSLTSFELLDVGNILPFS
jgi:hypothetical protein